MRHLILVTTLIALLFGFISCNKKETDTVKLQPKIEIDTLPEYNFEKGMKFYNRGDYSYAKPYFTQIMKQDTLYDEAQKMIKICDEKLQKEKVKLDEIMKKAEQKWLKSKAGKCYKFCQTKGAIVSKDDCEHAVNGKIWIGMNYWLLVYRRGNPNSINPSNYGDGVRYQYCWYNYTPSCFYDENGDNLIDSYN